jgi:hypothetical protein
MPLTEWISRGCLARSSAMPPASALMMASAVSCTTGANSSMPRRDSCPGRGGDQVAVAQDCVIPPTVGEQVEAVAAAEHRPVVVVLGAQYPLALGQGARLIAQGHLALAGPGRQVGLDPDAEHRDRADPCQRPGVEHDPVAGAGEVHQPRFQLGVHSAVVAGGADRVCLVKPRVRVPGDSQNLEQDVRGRNVVVAEIGRQPRVPCPCRACEGECSPQRTGTQTHHCRNPKEWTYQREKQGEACRRALGWQNRNRDSCLS